MYSIDLNYYVNIDFHLFTMFVMESHSRLNLQYYSIIKVSTWLFMIRFGGFVVINIKQKVKVIIILVAMIL